MPTKSPIFTATHTLNAEPILHCMTQKPLYVKHYLTDQQRLELLEATNESAVYLYEAYLRRIHFKHPDLEDSSIAPAIGWNERKTRHNRGLLTAAGWFLKTTSKTRGGYRYVHYHLGPEEVAQATNAYGLERLNEESSENR